MLAEPSPAAPSSALPWYRVWIKALTEPRVATYQDMVTRPGVTLGKACLWVAVVGAISAIFFVVGGAAFRGLSQIGPTAQPSPDGFGFLTSTGFALACFIPLAAVGGILGLLLSAGISHLLARALGGTGTYEQLAYALAAYSAPGSLVSSAVSVIPCVGAVISIPLSFYLIFLNILSIKAVHNISWGRAVLSSVVFFAFVLALLACVVIVILALMGPAIGTVFSGIIGEI